MPIDTRAEIRVTVLFGPTVIRVRVPDDLPEGSEALSSFEYFTSSYFPSNYFTNSYFR